MKIVQTITQMHEVNLAEMPVREWPAEAREFEAQLFKREWLAAQVERIAGFGLIEGLGA